MHLHAERVVSVLIICSLICSLHQHPDHSASGILTIPLLVFDDKHTPADDVAFHDSTVQTLSKQSSLKIPDLVERLQVLYMFHLH